MFLRIFKHLLPIAKAWQITIGGTVPGSVQAEKQKDLRLFFEGLTGLGSDYKEFLDLIWKDIFPDTTREIELWENQFGLRNTGLDNNQRRNRLDAAWKSIGGQNPAYIQETLRNNGFDVYVHEWWVPGSDPPVARDPLDYLRRKSNEAFFLISCGEDIAECGEAIALCGNSTEPIGYPLVNKIFKSVKDIIPQSGEDLTECGESIALCGEYVGYRFEQKEYVIPDNPDFWPYFLYIGGETFGDTAVVDTKRKNEFETLCLKVCPTQQWLGLIIQYL